MFVVKNKGKMKPVKPQKALLSLCIPSQRCGHGWHFSLYPSRSPCSWTPPWVVTAGPARTSVISLPGFTNPYVPEDAEMEGAMIEKVLCTEQNSCLFWVWTFPSIQVSESVDPAFCTKLVPYLFQMPGTHCCVMHWISVPFSIVLDLPAH